MDVTLPDHNVITPDGTPKPPDVILAIRPSDVTVTVGAV
jgi:hypothetical protein